jgi:hypothetical protein
MNLQNALSVGNFACCIACTNIVAALLAALPYETQITTSNVSSIKLLYISCQLEHVVEQLP